jgi:hypothetical protein
MKVACWLSGRVRELWTWGPRFDSRPGSPKKNYLMKSLEWIF